MRFLITGITGFVGPHLADLLLDHGHEVWGLIRGSNGRENDLLDVLKPEKLERIHWLYGDLTFQDSLQNIFSTHPFDGVFHLAAQSHVPFSFQRPILTFHENVVGSVNLIECVRTYQPSCRLHFCSTSEVYGNECSENSLLNEDSPLKPINPYAVSKTSVDLFVQERIRNEGMNAFITRAFSHTGPRRGSNFSISSDAYQIAKMMLGFQDCVLLVGNLETKRVVIDVRDCVRAYYQLMMTNFREVFNVCGEEVHPMNFFTDKLIQISGLDRVEKRIHPPFYRPVDIQVQQSDNTKIQQAVGWVAQTPIEETLQNLLDYWVCKLS